MSQFKDFEGEFQPVKKYNLQELYSDKFILRLNREKQFNKAADQKSEPRTNDATTNQPKPKKKVLLSGTNELKQELSKRKRKKTLMLVGTKSLREMLEMKRARNDQAANEAAKNNSTPEGPETKKRKRQRIKLIPFTQVPPGPGVHQSPQKVPKKGDDGSQEDLESEDEFVDALLQFHEVTKADLEGLAPKDNEETTQIEVDETDSSDDTLEFYDTAKQAPEGSPQISETQNELELDSLSDSGDLGSGDLPEEKEVGDRQPKPSGDGNSGANGVDETNGDQKDLEFSELPSVSARDIALMKLIIKPQISGLTFPQLHKSSLAPAYKEIHSIIEHTIKDYEGHSLLLVGPRGSGKTYVADKAIDDLRQKYKNHLITIKLNALLHHDDKLAFREIARQLDIHSRVMRQELADTFEQRAISDTFANILKILDSNARNSDEGQGIPVVIIIDEIEKFTGGGKQTLLYNLFELSQSSKTPICVIGISTKATTRELLEKRVRSRFSQRIVSTERAPTLEVFWENARLNLLVPEEKFASFDDVSYPKLWNKRIEAMFYSPTGLKKAMYKIFYTTKNYKDFYHCCQIPVSGIAEKAPFPRAKDFEIYMLQLSPGYAQTIVESLSNLELLLAIAAARWIVKSEVPQVNFNLAYKEYTEMMKRMNLEATTLNANSSFVDSTILASIKVNQKVWTSKVMRDCWANLYNMGLLFDVITSNNEVNVNNNYNMYKNMVIEDSKMLQLDISLEELGLLIDELVSFKKLTRL